LRPPRFAAARSPVALSLQPPAVRPSVPPTSACTGPGSLSRAQDGIRACIRGTCAGGYAKLAPAVGIEHFIVGNKPGTRVAAGRYHFENVDWLHARYDRFIKPFCGPAPKILDGHIRWLGAQRN